MNADQSVTEHAALERQIYESTRLIRVTLDDIAAALERLRQLRQRDDDEDADHRLIVEVGPNGRPEVCR